MSPPTDQLSLEQALLLALDRTQTLVPCDDAAIVLRSGMQARVIAARCRRAGDSIALDGAPMLARAFDNPRPGLVAYPANNDAFFGALLPSLGAHCFVVRVPVPERPANALLIVTRLGGKPFEAREIGALEGIAHQSGLIMEHSRRYVDLQHQADYLEAAAHIGRQVSLQLDVDALLVECVNILHDHLRLYQVHILLVDAARDDLVLRASSGFALNTERLGMRLKVGAEGITGWVAASGEPLLANDVRQETKYISLNVSPATRSELAVPLRAGNRIIGVLDVQDDRLDRFQPSDQFGMQVVADQVAIALENVRLYAETRRRLDAMQSLHAVSLDIVAQLNLDELLSTLLQRAARLVQAEAAALYKCSPSGEVIDNIASFQTGTSWVGRPARVGRGHIGLVVQSGEPVIVPDYPTWEHGLPEFRTHPLTARMAVPLRWQTGVFGALLVLNPADGHRFDADDQQILTAFADLCAIALKNAELYTQVATFGRTLESQVAERTAQLEAARRELLEKAEQVQWLLSKTVHIQEEERARIARDLHDGVTQLAIGALYELQAAKSELDGNGAALDRINGARELLKQIERELREAVHGLRPILLDASGLPTALQKYAESVQALSGLRCTVQTSGTPAGLPPAVEVVIFRIVQEALHNVTAHAQAAEARVTLDFQPQRLQVRIADDGRGFDTGGTRTVGGLHVGLAGMRERAAVIGARLEVESELGRGTRICLTVNLTAGVPPDEIAGTLRGMESPR